MRLKLASLALFPMLLLGCSAPGEDFAADGSCAGVKVEINFSGQSDNLSRCVNIAEGGAIAKDVLASAGITIEGTKAYGDQVICRVNQIPSETEPLRVEGEEPYVEACDDMPAAFAYWGLWVRSSDQAEWEYAMEGISSLQLTPGQSIGLAFSLAGEAPTPTD